MKKLTLIIFLCALPLTTHASQVAVEVRAGAENINAVEGTLVLPADVSVKRVNTAGSVVLLWVTEPTLNPHEHTISFAGLVPGGFTGTQTLLTLDLASGGASSLRGTLSGYRNDGKGTRIDLTYGFAQASLPPDDHEWPEPFVPTIARSPDLFEGRAFVSFLTQDKASGIDHYEYASTWLLSPREDAWQRATSPMMLSRADLFKTIRIRAYDAAGYYREEVVHGPYQYVSYGIGIILLLCALLFARRSFSRLV
jgi:hypothetical protein